MFRRDIFRIKVRLVMKLVRKEKVKLNHLRSLNRTLNN